MARIKSAPVEAYAECGEDADELTRILAHRPPLAEAVGVLHEALRTDRVLPDRLLELVRLRIAFWNQCRPCMATRFPEAFDDGLTEAAVCSLERPQEAEDLTAAERAAIAYADLMATDHLGITDATYEGLREYFTEPQIVELSINVAYFVGIGRMTASIDMVQELPERLQNVAETGTPWDDANRVEVS